MPSGSRRRSRILAFQVLFEAEQHEQPVAETLADEITTPGTDPAP